MLLDDGFIMSKNHRLHRAQVCINKTRAKTEFVLIGKLEVVF